MEEKVTMQEWAARFHDYYRSIRLGGGMSRRQIEAFERACGVSFPEDYAEFMELTGGADIRNGRVCIWTFPKEDGSLTGADGKPVPEWKSILYFNSPEIKASIPFSDGVFLVAGNEMGDYLGLTREKKGYLWKYISPDMNDFWYYSDFESWLKEVWEKDILLR